MESTTVQQLTYPQPPPFSLHEDIQDQDLDSEPTISPTHLRYIHCLRDTPTPYTRYFDALLIRKASHGEFLTDLKAFRSQLNIIVLIEQGTKDSYRECTRRFVGSRFAHPWCRVSSDFHRGWTRASWVGGTKKVEKAEKAEEERLHRLLVPVWIAFRRRMFPEPGALEEWIAREEERVRAEAGEAKKAEDATSPDSSPSAPYPELGFKFKSTQSESAASASKPSDSSATAAGQMFLGMAITGFIMSDKRVKKYVRKKLLKK